MTILTSPTLPIREISWFLDQPAQVNRGTYSGSRVVVANPWHGKWRASVTLATQQGEANIRAFRSFLTSLQGQVNTFLLPATEGNQLSLAGGTQLDLNFSAGTYSSQSTSYALTALPGYSYSRTGTVSYYNATNATDTIDTFAANVAPVVSNSVGYEAYEALNNVLTYSQQIDNAAWTKNNLTVTANAATAPDGTVTMDKLVEPTGSFAPSIYQTSSDYTTTTVSVYAQAAGRRYAFLRLYVNSNDFACILFDLQAGTMLSVTDSSTTLTSVNGYIVNCGNGTYRCVAVYTRAAAGTIYAAFNLSDSATPTYASVNGDYTYTGGGTNGVYVWQFQTLKGGFADGGPLIATTTAAASIGAPTFSVNCPNGSYTATYTFDDNSTQSVPKTISGGVFTLDTYPTTLNRPTVKHCVVTGSPSGITASASAAQGATSVSIGSNPGLKAGMFATFTLPSGNRQMVMLTADASSTTFQFMPALREAISSGAAIEVANPCCLVALAQSEYGWNVGQWRLYGMSFDVEEAF